MNAAGGHAAELRDVQQFVALRWSWPAVLLIEGEPGIGKSTLLLAAKTSAEEAGVRVLTARARPADSSIPFCGVADLLSQVNLDSVAGIPADEWAPLDRIARRSVPIPRESHRDVANAFLAAVRHLAVRSPVLLAVDDVDTLDRPSRHVLRFIASRLPQPVALVVTALPPQPRRPGPAAWLQPPFGVELRRMTLKPLPIGPLNNLLTARLGRRLPRRTISQIQQISLGNVHSALELAGNVDADGSVNLPASLAHAAFKRLGTLEGARAAVLLALACERLATVANLAEVADSPAELVTRIVEHAETQSLVTVGGDRVSYTHPVLALTVYSSASAPDRRAMHRRLAQVTSDPSARARHLALGSTDADRTVLTALDEAARLAASRGLPADAAEFLEMAIRLGDRDSRRILQCARFHCIAGEFNQAELLADAVDDDPSVRSKALLVRGVARTHNAKADAVQVLASAVEYGGTATRIQALMRLSLLSLFVGNLRESLTYADAAATEAQRSTNSGEARALHILTSELGGSHDPGFEVRNTPDAGIGELAVAALACAWTGDVDGARHHITTALRTSRSHGNPSELVCLSYPSVMIDLWAGHLDAAADTAALALDEAELVGDPLNRAIALAAAAAVASYRGDEPETVRLGNAAATAADIGGYRLLSLAPCASIASVQIADRRYGAALKTLEPVVAQLGSATGRASMLCGFVPDAIEALAALGRSDEAEALVSALDSSGKQDGCWARMVRLRGHACVLAARGDLRAAEVYAEGALDMFADLPMPLERARTLLLLGQVQRRRRRRAIAAANIAEAATVFADLGSTAWARRAVGDLQGSPPTPAQKHLTPAERRVAELAAAGLSNRDIAAEVFVSVKTVEMNLSRVYRKLGIRSRSQLRDKLLRKE